MLLACHPQKSFFNSIGQAPKMFCQPAMTAFGVKADLERQ
jgi:hypothetical protein